MALFKSQILTQASGSVGGTTFAHAKGGMYMRARSMPVNPNTPQQGLARAALTAAVGRWSSVLSPTQRAGWDLYAANVAVTNRLGDSVFLSGQNMYVRSNQVSVNATNKGIGNGLNYDAPPALFNVGDYTTPFGVTADAVSGLSISFENTDDWANNDAGVMFIYMGRPQSATRNYFRGPWRLVAGIIGDTAGPAPTSPYAVSLANTLVHGYPLIAGQQIIFESQVIQADGRLSSRRRLPPAIVTP